MPLLAETVEASKEFIMAVMFGIENSHNASTESVQVRKGVSAFLFGFLQKTLTLSTLAATCPSEEDDQKRIFGGGEESLSSIGALTLPKLVFNRTSYCCEDNLCNAGDRSMLVSVGVIGIALAVNAIVE